MHAQAKKARQYWRWTLNQKPRLRKGDRNSPGIIAREREFSSPEDQRRNFAGICNDARLGRHSDYNSILLLGDGQMLPYEFRWRKSDFAALKNLSAIILPRPGTQWISRNQAGSREKIRGLGGGKERNLSGCVTGGRGGRMSGARRRADAVRSKRLSTRTI
jgi:hypothetical protein